MLNSKYTRTTITIPEEILWAIKAKALMEKRAFKEVVTDGLRLYLSSNKKYIMPEKAEDWVESLFGSWGKGKNGKEFLKEVRYNKKNKKREVYLEKLWKKS